LFTKTADLAETGGQLCTIALFGFNVKCTLIH